jgi:Protein of unknown function (DUF1822)
VVQYKIMINILNNPIQPWLEIPEETQNQAWRQHQTLSTPSSRWNAYINQLALTAILEWLRQDIELGAIPTPNPTNIWEFINGTPIKIENTRCIIIPTTAIDTSELVVPQEWVDIPYWVADYYIAAQVDIEQSIVKIYGYTTHLALKQQGQLNLNTRTYSLSSSELINDINILWASHQLCPEVETKAEITALPALELAQANNLIERLGNVSVLIPRLAIPFSAWGALLTHDGWRQRLYEKRIGLPEQRSLSQWFLHGISELASLAGWNAIGYQASVATRSINRTNTVPTSYARQLQINNALYELQIQLEGDIVEGTIKLSLQSLSTPNIPTGFILRLLTEDLAPFPNNESITGNGTTILEITVSLEEGEGIVWEIEPTPENYEREILRL